MKLIIHQDRKITETEITIAVHAWIPGWSS